MRSRFLLPALLLALQAVPGAVQAQSGSRAALRGDVDRDGEVTAADAFSILTASIGKTPPAEYRLMPNGDADANGRISISDVLLVLGYSVGRQSPDVPVGQPLVAVSLAADSSSLEAGRSTTLRATVAGTTDSGIIWRSSAPAVADVDAQGRVQGHAAGTATIFAIAHADTVSRAWMAISVHPAQLASLTVSPTSTIVATVGQTVQLRATAVDDQGHTVSQPLTWTSSDTTLATVDGLGKVAALRPGTATIRASGGGKSAAASVQVRSAAVASLSVSPTSVSLAVGERVTLSATPSDSAGTALAGRTVGWSSSNPAVATVAALTSLASSGSVSAVAPGTAVITATSEGKSASVTVTVPAPAPAAVASLTVAPSTTLLRSLGEAAQLSAKLYDASGALLTGRAVSWASSDTSVAVVDAAGKVTARSNGTARVTASAEGKSAADSVVVSQAVASLALSPVSASVAVGQTAQLSAIARDAGGSVVSGTTFTWTSANPSIATVSAAGVVKGVAVGSAMVTATNGAKSASLTVQVTAAAVASVSLSPATLSLARGQTAVVTATLRDAGANVLSGRTVLWTTSDSSIAAVTATGVVSAVAPGTVTIMATSEGKSAVAAVTVTAPAPATPTDSAVTTVPTDSVPVDSVSAAPVPVVPVPDTIILTPAADSLTALGQTLQLVATVKDGTGNVLDGQAITWSSSNPAMASVSASGLVTALANGNVSITAAAGSATSIAQLVVSQRAASLSISPATVQFTALGDSISLAAVAKDANGYSLSNCSTTWLSTNPTVAIVKNSGWVVARAVGAAMVLASCGAMTDSVGVDVQQVVSSVVITSSSPSVAVGDTAHLAATAKDAAGTVVSGAAFTWSSSNPTVATVNSEGDVYAKSQGTATITASADGKSASAPVSVENPGTPAISIDFENGYKDGDYVYNAKPVGVGTLPFAWKAIEQKASSVMARSGSRSMKASYKGLIVAQTSEQWFDFHQQLPELWMEYWVYFPTNFTPTPGSQWKGLLLYNDKDLGVDNWAGAFMVMTTSADGQQIHARFEAGNGAHTDPSWTYWSSPVTLLNVATDLGKWHQLRFHIKSSSDSSTKDGQYQFWWDGKLVTDQAISLHAHYPDAPYLRTGYFFGAGAGSATFPAEGVDMYLDDIKIYSANPGW